MKITVEYASSEVVVVLEIDDEAIERKFIFCSSDAPSYYWENKRVREALLKIPQQREPIMALSDAGPIPLICFTINGERAYSEALEKVEKNPSVDSIESLKKAFERVDRTTTIYAGFICSDLVSDGNGLCSGWLYTMVGDSRYEMLHKMTAQKFLSQEVNPPAILMDMVRERYPDAKIKRNADGSQNQTSMPWRSFDWGEELAPWQRGEGVQNGNKLSWPMTWNWPSLWYGMDFGAINRVLQAAETGREHEEPMWGACCYPCQRMFREVAHDSIPRAMRIARRNFAQRGTR